MIIETKAISPSTFSSKIIRVGGIVANNHNHHIIIVIILLIRILIIKY